MDLEGLKEKEGTLKTSIRKNCMLCMGRAHLGRPTTPEKDFVQKELKDLYSNYEAKFNALRKADADGSEIQNAGNNKRFVLDVISECKNCDREIERASRAMQKLK